MNSTVGYAHRRPNLLYLLAATTNGAAPPARDRTPVAVHPVGSQCTYGLICALAEQTDRAVNALVTVPIGGCKNIYKPRYELYHMC